MTARNEFSTVKNLLLMQVLIAISVASGFFVLGGWKNALSPFLGSSIALLPNCYFAYRLYLSRNWDAKKIVRSFYASESKKLFLTAALFAIAFQIPDINLLTLLIGYLAVLSTFWFALILWRN
ncbi:ATP synthase subunit I [Methylomarinum sp. Ch1-1]|uniref:ATP synthase subunit I n=1 Tax=Methylomarinum roseum TaxID=3067653 RepID=A0AAU7NWE4_9GAMM